MSYISLYRLTIAIIVHLLTCHLSCCGLKLQEHHGWIFTYMLLLIQPLTNNILSHLAKTLQLLSNNCRVAFQWILTHCDFSGNEQADKLAKEGATVSYQNRMPIPKQVWCQEKSAYHLLSMSEQVIMIRQRTGHNRMNAHMHEQLKMVPWAACPCGEEDQTKEHIHITVKGMTINDMQLDRTKKKMKKLQV